MHGTARGLPLVLMFLGIAAGCGGHNGQAAQSIVLSGRVLNESGAAISGAQVAVYGGAEATTDATGTYKITVANGPGVVAPFSFSASGYAPAQRAVVTQQVGTALPDLTLRAIDKVATVALPQSPSAPVAVSVAKHDGQVTLTIPANGLVDGTGAIVSGEVEVSLTYWHPQDLGPSMPGFLSGVDRDGAALRRLYTYGMADVSVAQAGRPLEVAPGANVTLAFTIGAVKQRALDASQPASLPSIFYLDPTIAQWREVRRVQDGNVTFDATAGVFTTALPHFSAWNSDEGAKPNSGGCVSGQVIDGCTGAPLVGQNVTFWTLSFEEVTSFPGRSDGNGNYCITTGTPDRASFTAVPYLVTGSVMSQTNQANPLPTACRTCTDNWMTTPTGTQCNRCRNWPDSPTTRNLYPDTPGSELGPNAPHWYGFYGSQSPSTPIDQLYIQPGSSPTVTISPCTFCPADRPASCNNSYGLAVSSMCPQVETLIIPGPGCLCVQPGQPCQSNQTCCIGKGMAQMTCQSGVCAVKPPGVGLGMPCDISITCADGLICGDGICIPQGGT